MINQSTNIPQNISRITKDINDNLWIAATDYIYKYDQVLSFTRMIEGLTELQTVSDIHVDSEDNIWLTIADEFRFGGEHILGHVDNSWSSYMAEVYLIDQLYEDENGAIKFTDFIQQSVVNGDSIESDSLFILYPAVPTPYAKRIDFLKHQNGTDWLTGFELYNDYQIYSSNQSDTQAYGINTDYIFVETSDIDLDCEGRLLCISDNNFLNQYANDQWSYSSKKNIIINDLTTRLHAGQSGCYWVRASGAFGISVEKVVIY